ncbi:MAG: VWA domain-containing protein [Chlamydiota bacterium]
MDSNNLSYAHQWVLWGLTLIPLVWLFYAFFYRTIRPQQKLEEFIDKHLIKYLLVSKSGKNPSVWKTLVFWSFAWALLIIALAGPRWSYREIETYSSDQNLIILLDLSQSMDADDVKSSRLVRARQKIEDLLNQSQGVQIGLIAFAADPHMITPLTQDTKTIKHLLPSLDTNLVHVQGSRLGPALEMAETMFASSPGENQAILVVSDGGFEDSSALRKAQSMSDKNIKIYSMGVGTAAGAPVRDQKGNFVKKGGSTILSKLEKEKLQQLSQVGGGRYLEANLARDDEALLLNDLKSRAANIQELKRKIRLWDEQFYWFILPVLPLILFWIRRGHIIPLLFIIFTPTCGLDAADIGHYFMNSQQLGAQALEEEDYDKAQNHFEDPYRKGVAQYRAGNYAEAESHFRDSTRPEVEKNASYNIGNALVFQDKLEEAIKQYEAVLKKWPDHQKAIDNLEIVKKMLEQEEEKNQENEDSGDTDQNESDDRSEKGKDSDQQDDKESSQQNEPSNDQQDPGEQDSKEQKNTGDNAKDSEQGEDQEGIGEQDQEKEKQSGEEETDQNPEQGQDLEQQKGESQEQEKESSLQEKNLHESASEMEQSQNEQSQEDRDADQWLNRMHQEPTEFLRNKFYIESTRKGTKEAVDPW